MSNTTPISVLILAQKNSEVLQQVLSSVAWADEIIIFWSGSDAVQQFEQSRTRRVLKRDLHITDFAELRNAAMTQAKHDWVFFVDSDEVVDECAQDKIEAILQENTDIHGIVVQRKDIFLRKELNWGEVRDVRLTRILRKQFCKYTRAVHEVVQIDGQVLDSNILLRHYPHHSIHSFLEKIRYYSQLEIQLRKNPSDWRVLFELLTFPAAKFLYNFVLRLGFLDGWRGLIYAVVMSLHSLSVRAGVLERSRSKS